MTTLYLANYSETKTRPPSRINIWYLINTIYFVIDIVLTWLCELRSKSNCNASLWDFNENDSLPAEFLDWKRSPSPHHDRECVNCRAFRPNCTTATSNGYRQNCSWYWSAAEIYFFDVETVNDFPNFHFHRDISDRRMSRTHVLFRTIGKRRMI